MTQKKKGTDGVDNFVLSRRYTRQSNKNLSLAPKCEYKNSEYKMSYVLCEIKDFEKQKHSVYLLNKSTLNSILP